MRGACVRSRQYQHAVDSINMHHNTETTNRTRLPLERYLDESSSAVMHARKRRPAYISFDVLPER